MNNNTKTVINKGLVVEKSQPLFIVFGKSCLIAVNKEVDAEVQCAAGGAMVDWL